MKKLILNNWAVKITSLVLAITLWFLIKKNVETTPSPSSQMPTVQFPPNQPAQQPQHTPEPETTTIPAKTTPAKSSHGKQNH